MALFLGVAATASAAADLSATEQAFLTGTSPGGHAERPTAILVMAVGRSGSSMVGEFFNQNKVSYEAYIGTKIFSVNAGNFLLLL